MSPLMVTSSLGLANASSGRTEQTGHSTNKYNKYKIFAPSFEEERFAKQDPNQPSEF